ncbi:ferrous iron transporter A [Campylobacter jejuni]|nr:ferrous iron transporter A [Campylobacter jejuni]
MKKFHLSLSLGLLALLFNACSVSQMPNSSSQSEQINASLPKIENLKSMSDMSNVAFEWQPLYDQNIDGFYLYRSSEQKPEFKLVAQIKNKFQTHYVDDDLEPGTKYYYTLKTFNNQKHISEQGAVVEVMTEPRFDSVTFAQAITNLPGKTKLIWRPHTDLRVKSYIIERSRSAENKFEKIAEVRNRLNAEYIDENLKPNESFDYRIICVTFDGIKSNPSQIINSTTKALPPQVEHLSASQDAANKIILTWDSVPYEDFDYYKVYATSSSFLPYTTIAKTQTNSYEDYIQGVDETKYYKVTMVDKDGLESPMPKEGVQGKTLSSPLAPSIILSAIREDGVELEWADGDNRASEYTLKRYGGKQDAIFKGLKDKRFKDTTIEAGVSYTYEVIAIDQYGLESKPSGRIRIGK